MPGVKHLPQDLQQRNPSAFLWLAGLLGAGAATTLPAACCIIVPAVALILGWGCFWFVSLTIEQLLSGGGSGEGSAAEGGGGGGGGQPYNKKPGRSLLIPLASAHLLLSFILLHLERKKSSHVRACSTLAYDAISLFTSPLSAMIGKVSRSVCGIIPVLPSLDCYETTINQLLSQNKQPLSKDEVNANKDIYSCCLQYLNAKGCQYFDGEHVAYVGVDQSKEVCTEGCKKGEGCCEKKPGEEKEEKEDDGKKEETVDEGKVMGKKQD
ncbi:hypothetical protein QBC44DRAFT_307447 [Cladorrhinum sp. PSN332]|nr:hypothetical protein QBC44DRAFT_307447 [Cladorrhinum sp. PSN332]